MTNEELQAYIRLLLKRESLQPGDEERHTIDEDLAGYMARADDTQRYLIAEFINKLHTLLEPFPAYKHMSVEKAIVLYTFCFLVRSHGGASAQILKVHERALKAQERAHAVLAAHGVSCPTPVLGQSFDDVLAGLLEGESIE